MERKKGRGRKLQNCVGECIREKMRFFATLSTVHVSVCSQCDFPPTSLSSLSLHPFNVCVRHGSFYVRECSNIIHTSFASGSQDGQYSFALLENRHHLNRGILILCIKKKERTRKIKKRSPHFLFLKLLINLFIY